MVNSVCTSSSGILRSEATSLNFPALSLSRWLLTISEKFARSSSARPRAFACRIRDSRKSFTQTPAGSKPCTTDNAFCRSSFDGESFSMSSSSGRMKNPFWSRLLIRASQSVRMLSGTSVSPSCSSRCSLSVWDGALEFSIIICLRSEASGSEYESE